MKGTQRVLVIDDDRGRPLHELLREYAALHDTSPPSGWPHPLVCNAAAECQSTTCHHRNPHERAWDCENTDICYCLSPERETTCVEANVKAEGSE